MVLGFRTCFNLDQAVRLGMAQNFERLARFSGLYTASVTQAWTRSMATAQSGSVSIILLGAFSSAAVSLLAVSLAKRQIANQAFVLASSTVALLSNSAFAAITLSSTEVAEFARARNSSN